MYIECKGDGLTGEARIGLVSFSKTGKTITYKNQSFRSLKGAGYKSNYYDIDSGVKYWITGPKKKGGDRLYNERVPVYVDDDIREEYWTKIRKQPENIHKKEL